MRGRVGGGQGRDWGGHGEFIRDNGAWDAHDLSVL